MAANLINDFTLTAQELCPQGHLAVSVRRATQAWVESANYGLNTIEHSLLDLFSLHEVFGDLENPLVHRQVVVTRCDNQVHPLDQTVFVDFVVVNERTPRRL